jgi:hypothetical protein
MACAGVLVFYGGSLLEQRQRMTTVAEQLERGEIAWDDVIDPDGALRATDSRGR